ncbi:hypothetical protein [Elizabethkingia anophelis]|uniref:hypothetical protein n=1 Tax=Elizabethkingia anophelis TaxID=1117645 RepID=UPI0002ABD5F2|nr:hypothetical protein [Elizabethkingia anophelis]ELR81202.1 hypothetical protein D505_00470 [Elizabethkingia anophelis R26]MCS7369676.1 hypothetical protein [Elizabethkingia anophelis]MCS7374993.1 hypothetical protein [Elizabethkingia anophelis]MCS7387351.1 hypothetical protein [Elizabethkingia anophelis]HAY3597940.1 hypothetical protein [Elizabethkingia anophelis]
MKVQIKIINNVSFKTVENWEVKVENVKSLEKFCDGIQRTLKSDEVIKVSLIVETTIFPNADISERIQQLQSFM